jgi:hypothetical protein
MTQSRPIAKLGATLALLGLFLLAQTAESQGLVEQLVDRPDAATNDQVGVDALVQEQSSDALGDAAQGRPDINKLDSLEKTWKAKEAHAQKAYQDQTVAQQAKLREHLHQERLAKMSMQLQVDVSKDSGKVAIPKTTDAHTAKELVKSQESVTHLKQQLKDQKLKAALSAKKQDVDAKQKLAKQLAATKIKYRKRLDAANTELIKDHKREAEMVKQVVKDKTKKEATKVKLADMAQRKSKRKGDYKKALADNLALKRKLVQEKALREKAVDTAMKLGKKIRTLGMFGKKSADLAKDQALQAAKATADAKEQVNLVKAQKVKATAEATRLKAQKAMQEQQLQELKAQMTSLEAQGIHEHTLRRQVERSLITTQAHLNQTLLETDALNAKIVKHKLAEKRVAAEALKRKAEEKKALVALNKVGVIQKALTVSQQLAARYSKENKLQRGELAAAADQLLLAANVTRTAAAHAEKIEQEALVTRQEYQDVVKAAQKQLSHEHDLRMGAQHQSDALLQEAKKRLLEEHKLRQAAQAAATTSGAQAAKASADAAKDHQAMLATKATAAKIAADKQAIMQRAKAATQMIAVESAATQEAKKAAADLQKADAKKLADLTTAYDKKLAKEHAKSVQAEAIAKTITDRTGALQDAMAHQKAILKEEQAKAQNERAQWHKAMDAFSKERAAHREAKGAMDASTKAMMQKAQLAIDRASKLAKDKNVLLGQLKDQLHNQASKFADASTDWEKVKHALQLRVKTAEEEAADANAKLAELAKQQQADSVANYANTAVNQQLDHTQEQAGHDQLYAVPPGATMEFNEELVQEDDEAQDEQEDQFTEE